MGEQIMLGKISVFRKVDEDVVVCDSVCLGVVLTPHLLSQMQVNLPCLMKF